nr:unnamed protein product [Callosobruchus analis]
MDCRELRKSEQIRNEKHPREQLNQQFAISPFHRNTKETFGFHPILVNARKEVVTFSDEADKNHTVNYTKKWKTSQLK